MRALYTLNTGVNVGHENQRSHLYPDTNPNPILKYEFT